MELVDANAANSGGVQKSSTAIAESSQEVSIEKTATGSIEKAISSQSKLEQSVVQQKSMTSTSSVSADDSKDNGTTETTTTVTKTIKQQSNQNDDDDNNNSNSNNNDVETKTITKKVTIKKDTQPLIKKEVKINDEIVKIEDVQNDNDDDDDDDAETEIIEIIEGDEDGEEVEIVETVVIKKSTIQPPLSSSSTNNDDNNDSSTTSTTKTITTKKKIINKENSHDDSSNIDNNNNNQNTDVTVTLNKPKQEKIISENDNDNIKKDDIIIDEKKEISPIKQQEQKSNKIESVAEKKEEEPSKKEEIILKEKVIKETKNDEIIEKKIKEEVEEVEEDEEEEIEEEEEEEEEEKIKEETSIEDKNIIVQKPPLPTSVLHHQSSQDEHQQPKEYIPHQQQQQPQQQYQMQQQQQVGQHDKQEKYHRSPPSSTEIKQENIKNQLKEIISDIDRVIEQEEDKTSTSLPQQQQQQRQPMPMQQQQQQQQQQHQVSSTTTREESHDDGYTRKMERTERNEFQDRDDGSTQFRSTTTSTSVKSTPQLQQHHQLPPSGQNIYHYGTPPSSNIKLYDHRSMSLPSPYAVEQSSTSSTTKTIDLQKIFTPATDYEEILPKSRILYSSSAFYSPNLHPTVEDQVELARRISHSLSDISNQQSKGQSMYVNRKKRSVKWVHEGEGKAHDYNSSGYQQQQQHHHGYDGHKENEYERTTLYHDKVPLKLVMNPRGQVRDFTSVRNDYNQESSGMLSPDKCAELVAGLNAPKGKGAELFAKRRKKSEKWIVDETNAAQHSPSGVQPYGTISPNILPAYSDVGVQRVQLNMHQDQVQDKYSQPRIKMIKTPWEAALETGSASAAFQELPNLKQPASFVPQQSTGYDYNNYTPITYQQQQQQLQQQPQQQYHQQEYEQQYSQTQHQQQQQQKSWQPNSQRDLAYKPSIPQGWNAPPTTLPKELYVPKEIPLDGYIPPATEKYLPSNPSAYSTIQTSSSSLYSPSQQLYQTNDYSTSSIYQQQQQNQLTSSISGGGINDIDGGGGSSGYGVYGDIGLSTSPKQFPISKQYSSTLSSSYLSGGGGGSGGGGSGSGVSTLAPRSTSPYYQQQQQQQIPSVSGGVASTASTFNNYNINKNTFPVSSQKSSQYYSAPPINKPINNWRTQPNLGNHPSPVAFNPSPLPYEKLAKFQQPDPYDNNDGGGINGFRVPIPGIRRPLAVPSSGGIGGNTKIRNLSPLPYYKSSLSPSYNTQQQQQQQSTITTTTKTTTNYQTNQQQDNNSNQYYNDSSKYLSSSLSGFGGIGSGNDIIYGSGGGGCGGISTNKTSKLTSVDLSNCHNYNTSARGWGQTKNCYKPLTFTKSPITADMPYTDF